MRAKTPSLRTLLLSAALALPALPAAAAPLDPGTINKIVDQSLAHSQVMQTAAYLTDRIGGRMTNSPAMREAERYTQARFKEFGLSNVHSEGFDFGRGWWIENATVRMVAPRPLNLRSIPIAWTPPTNGVLSASVIVAPMAKERDFAEWKGKLAGKIVLVTFPAPPKDDDKDAPFKRLSKEDIAKLNQVEQPDFDPDFDKTRYERTAFARKLDAFLKAEGAVAWARMAYRDNGLVHGEGYRYLVGDTAALPAVEIAAEDYRRLARLAKTGPVTLDINSNVHYDDSDTKAYNILADLPGSDPKAGYVMAGAHLDSWVAADGATDNGAGSAIIMEAARILKVIGATPKRTIRFALWAGEEQGIHGSDAYVRAHLATRPRNPDAERAALGPSFNSRTYPVTPLPGYRDLAGYFNIDNGSGRLRGLYAEGNFAAVPILKDWLSPFEGFDAAAVVAERTGGTDHVYMQTVGLPGFQFIQDPLDYESRTHHSSLDSYDHLRAKDLRQAAIILASVLLSAANADKPIPAATLPTAPVDNDPFRYKDPAKD
jgi:carboxypeptidase Q